jgi:hypothetical protein
MNWSFTVSSRDSGAILLRCCLCVGKLLITSCHIRLNLMFCFTQTYMFVRKCISVINAHTVKVMYICFCFYFSDVKITECNYK